jgi:nitroimidazol reductase NimA-like FMN-containing flavoprotein (pyridoxamine 5'-phosphate oxidase superfamily)
MKSKEIQMNTQNHSKKMRRKDRELTRETAFEILNNGKFGVMALVDENGYPYGVPLHYVVIDSDLYFHSTADGGHKSECFMHNPKASFTIIDTEDGIKARSAIVFGTIEIMPDMKFTVVEKLVEKFVPQPFWEPTKAGIKNRVEKIIAYRLKTEHITAKFIDRPER